MTHCPGHLRAGQDLAQLPQLQLPFLNFRISKNIATSANNTINNLSQE
jgi:hypothetical protein